MTHSGGQPVGFLFINTAHPSEASTPRSLSQIRSHAAKENRARRAARTQARPAAVERTEGQLRRRSQPISNPAESSRLRAQEAEEAMLVLSFSTADPHWSPVRPLSAQETSLLDHYINHVILFNRGRCHEAGSSAPPWFTSMQLKCWVPFALADPGLLAALLLQSCRSLEKSIGRPGSYVETYMAESYILGNLEEWKVHLGAHTRMLELRGGVDTLGLDGFLKGVIEKSPWLFKQPSLPAS